MILVRITGVARSTQHRLFTGAHNLSMKISLFQRLVIGYIVIFSMVVAASIYTIYQLGLIRRATHSVMMLDNRIIDFQQKLTDSLLSQLRY